MAKTYKIGVIGGDGTGPEVVREGMKSLEAVQNKFDIKFDFTHFDYGGERYLKTGKTISDEEVMELNNFDAVFLGAIGHPDVKPGVLERGVLLKMRFMLDQYINLRPVKLFPNVETPLKDKGPEHIDFVVVRENTEGLYAGAGGTLRYGTPHEVATQESINTRFGVDRCLKYAFEYTQKRNKTNTLTLCGKTNVLTYASGLWERAFNEMGEKSFANVKRDYAHVDAITMWMVKNPEWFDVIVTNNLFGDIITDLGAVVGGGLGVAAGGNINPEGVSMFEPIGGSAPKYTGKDVINPIAAILAGKMMLEHLGEDKAAAAIGKATEEVIAKMDSQAAGKMGFTTTQIGDMVAERI